MNYAWLVRNARGNQSATALLVGDELLFDPGNYFSFRRPAPLRVRGIRIVPKSAQLSLQVDGVQQLMLQPLTHQPCFREIMAGHGDLLEMVRCRFPGVLREQELEWRRVDDRVLGDRLVIRPIAGRVLFEAFAR